MGFDPTEMFGGAVRKGEREFIEKVIRETAEYLKNKALGPSTPNVISTDADKEWLLNRFNDLMDKLEETDDWTAGDISELTAVCFFMITLVKQ